MERPSHISFETPHLSRRLPFFALAAFFQVGAVALIMTGFGHFTPIRDAVLKFVPDIEKSKDDHPYPPPEPTTPHKLVVEIPNTLPFDVAHPPAGGITVTSRTTGGDPPSQPKPPGPPDHAAQAIASTHTQPPYPPIAVRQNLEGKVLLRLTVLETGKVAKAEIVTSSGSDILDQAALSWILAHWAYKPATDHGQPVASQALASVDFNLKNSR